MKKNIYILFITLFFVIASSPFWGMFFYQKDTLNEKRSKGTFKYIKGINTLDAYIKDNHGFRPDFTYYYMKEYIALFKESPLPGRAIFGKNNWLFLGNDHNKVYNNSIGVIPIEQNILNKTINQIKLIQEYCNSINCDFYLIIAPNKSSIYDEYLPIKPNKKFKFRELLVSELSNTKIKVIDLYPFIRKQKKNNILYYKTDTHWNKYSGLIASKYVNNIIMQEFTIDSINLNDYRIEETTKSGIGDLSQMLMLENKIADIDFNIINWKSEIMLKDSIIEKNELPYGNITYVSNRDCHNEIKAFIYRDSFFEAMYTPFLSTIENTILFHQWIFDKKQINKVISNYGKPDFILFEIVERNLTLIEYK